MPCYVGAKINGASAEQYQLLPPVTATAHMKKRKRENNGKPLGRAGSSAGLFVDPESSDEGAVL